ncbi:MAG: hypothetical protein ACXW2G_02020 [Burkholderiaceae bacterium]
MMISKSLSALSVVLAFAAPAVLAQAPSGAAAVKASEPGKVTLAEAVQVAATVQAIDKAKRLVTLKGPEGNTFTVQAGPEVRNFDQIKVGDQVLARYVEALTLELKKGTGGIRERVERENTVAAKPGERPGIAAGRQITAIADVVAVDAAKQTVRLRGVERTIDLKVRDPKQLALVKVGDQVEATFTEAVALSVEPMAVAPKAAPKK